MTLHHLEIFVAVCREKTTHAAAQALNLSQPAVSKAITELEKYYQVQLFERINHRLYLSAIGKEMQVHALKILAMYEEMEEEITRKGKQNHLRIGASLSVGTRLLPQYIQTLTTHLTDFTYEAVVNNTSLIERKIENYELDLAIVEGAIENKNLIIKEIGEDELVLVARADHPLLTKQKLIAKELELYPFIAREDGSRQRNQLELYLKEQGITLMMNYSCSSVEAIKQALLYTDGISILSKMMLEEELKKGVLQVLPFPTKQFKRSIRLIYHKDKYVSKAMKMFFSLLE